MHLISLIKRWTIAWCSTAALVGPAHASSGDSRPYSDSGAPGAIARRLFSEGDRWLKLEWSDDHLLHFEFGKGRIPAVQAPLFVSALYKHANLRGASSFREISAQKFETTEMTVTVNGLCFSVQDKLRGNEAGSYCVPNMDQSWKTLTVSAKGVRNVYGLGQMFDEPGRMNVDRAGKVVVTAGDFGNIMEGYAGGAVGETLFPVAYALTNTERSWLLALDNIYKQSWDLVVPNWKIGMFGDHISGFVMVGANPLELRTRFMALSGRAPVPPRKIFGFWMSEYGYENWDEVDERLDGMRRDQFPIDGFFLDLQWFGNVAAGSDYTAMGKLTFDESKFPDPAGRISRYKRAGIGLIPIEESYVGRALPEYTSMGQKGYLAHECGKPTKPSYLTGEVTGNTSEWWGRGGMIDWSNREGAAFWHDSKRQNLARLGIIGHWLDLGEPEMFDPRSCYHGSGEPGKNQHQDIHNIFSLLWAESLWDGYARNNSQQRPYSILRSGNVGIQQYGAGLWSGDIGGNLESLAGHIASHTHVSWSGIDYYSSDIGGFHRNRASGQPLSDSETQENFTQWFANAAWFDVPFRTHVMNLDNNRKTAPNRIGHIESNKANLMHRYQLIPYYYSLAWKAWTKGEPLIAPMSMAYPADLSFRDVGDQRMLGDILIAAAATKGVYERSVRFPKGLWYDLRSDSKFISDGNSQAKLAGVPLYVGGIFQLPAYAKAGAIIPRLTDASIERLSRGKTRAPTADEMGLDIYVSPHDEQTDFTLYEDDGETVAYRAGAIRQIRVSQVTRQMATEVKIDGAVGSFNGESPRRRWLVDVHAPSELVFSSFEFLGQVVSQCEIGVDPEATCYRDGTSIGSSIQLVLSAEDVKTAQTFLVRWADQRIKTASAHFVCRDNDPALRYFGMYVVGNDPKLGNWDVNRGVALTTNAFLRGVWTGSIASLPAGSTLEWKCVKVHPQMSERSVEWQPGSNNIFSTPAAGGFAGMTQGSFVRMWDIGE